MGYIIADVAADGFMVEYAQREPEHLRGTIQTMVYLIRTIFGIISVIFIGLTMNGLSYGGYFTWSLTFNQIMGILAITTSMALPFIWFYLKEDIVEHKSFTNHCRDMYEIIQQRAIWQIMAYKFFSGIFAAFGA